MSIWWHSKNKSGKGTVTSVSIPFPLIFVFIACVIALFVPSMYSNPYSLIYKKYLYIVGVGFLLFFISKLFQYKKGIWTSWGMVDMPTFGKVCYLLGYALMIFGIINLIILLQ